MTDNFIRDYIRSSIHLVSILPDAFEPEYAPRGRWFGEDWQGATDWATAENAAGRNVYWTLNIVRDGLNKKPLKTDIVAIRGFGVDIDPPKGVTNWNASAALADLLMRGQPSYAIFTGRGVQGVWLSSDATIPHDTVEAVNRGLTAGFNGDNTHNVDRLFRLPGFVNHGDAKKRAAGYVPAIATLAAPFNGKTYEAAFLSQYFPAPVAPATVVETLPDGPRPDYTGPADDDELIRMMLRSRGGMGAMFGEKATVADLWEADSAVMAKFFPSDSGDDFNRSSADAALLAHLTFWTGNDPARIDRLFRRSGLMRDKWNRESYRTMSVGKAVSGCVNVYSRPKETQTSHVEPSRSAEVTSLPGVTLSGDVTPIGFLTVYEQKEYFAGCVYVADRNEVLLPSGDFLKPASFKSMYGGHNFQIDDEKSERNAFLAFTENALYKFPKVLTTMFEPDLPFGYISHNRSAVNVYITDPNVIAEEGDVTPMINHVAKMLPDPRDAEILWTYLAAVVQHPGEKFQWAPFIQGVPGNGKSMIGQILKKAVGARYTHEPFSDDLANKFNDWLDSRILIIVEELSLGERVEVENNIKTWITQDEIEMQAKGGKKTMRPNKSNWLIFSNFQNAFPFDDNQRRVAPFFTAQQNIEDVRRDFPVGYFPALWNWLRDGGFQYLTHYLQTRPLHADFNPMNATRDRAPETSSTSRAVTASRGRFEQEILEAIESGKQGFRGGWISSTAVSALIKDLRLRISPVKLRGALESLGYVQWGRSTVLVMAEGGTKPVLYIKKGQSGDAQGFIVAQGYPA